MPHLRSLLMGDPPPKDVPAKLGSDDTMTKANFGIALGQEDT